MDEVARSLMGALMKLGMTEEEAISALAGLAIIKRGNVYGHTHLENVLEIVGRALDRQHAKSITIKVSKEGDEETYDGHLEIEVIEVEETRKSLP